MLWNFEAKCLQNEQKYEDKNYNYILDLLLTYFSGSAVSIFSKKITHPRAQSKFVN
jgi:hypothetical protein